MSKCTWKYAFAMVAWLVGSIGSAWAAPYLAIFGNDAENKVYHFYIDESEGETNSIPFLFSPNEANVTEAQIFTTLNRRDQATLYPADPATVNAGDTNGYWGAYAMANAGSGNWSLTLPVQKCGSYDIRARYKVSGDGNWRYYGGRNPVVNISDVETRDMVVYEMQANVVNASGNDYASRSTFATLTNSANNWNIDYISSLGVNTVWLQPFHPIGAKSDCNTGDPGSPYSIKNLFQVAEYLGSDGTRETAMKEFTNFVIKAQSQGVKVIFDVIFNHVSTDIEIERDPENPNNLYSNPLAEMRNVKPQWFSKYLGVRSGCETTKPQSDWGNYKFTEPAANSSQIGPAPADRNDFVWPDAFDLFWGTYSALGDIQNTQDGEWNASADVKKMTEYYAYFVKYWIEKTGGTMGGFRCDFAQGLPRQAWQYLINKGKSIKPEMYFVSESLDGGNIAYRAWKGGFDAINENQLWAIVEDGDIQTTDLRSVIDARKTQFGLALILRGTMNHDQGPWIGRKWDAVAMHSVFAAIDGTPQLYQGQELGYDALGQFSRERVEFGRTIPDIRNYHNFNNLWSNRNNGDNTALWYRYKDANLGRSRSVALRVADQYYIDRTGGQGPHPKIFSVLKYTKNGWDPKDQDVVFACVNLQPGTAHSGTFNVNVSPIYLNPTRTYNVRNLASSTPNVQLWANGRSGADIAANGISVSFPADKGAEGSIAQYLKLEEHGGGGSTNGLVWIGNTRHYPTNGAITSVDDIWVDIESYPIGAANGGTVSFSLDGVNWSNKVLALNGTQGNNDAWHANLGKFAASATIRYAVQITQASGTNFVANNNGSNFVAMVNSGGGGNGQTLQWIGTVTHYPTNGAITSADDIWVDIQSWPTGTAASGFVVFSSDNGQTWPTVPLVLNYTSDSNDFWHANLGPFAAGKTIQYAVSLIGSPATNQLWANNGGSNYTATVNGSSSNIGSTVNWVGNTVPRGLRVPEMAGLMIGSNGAVYVGGDAARSGSVYRLFMSTNLHSWAFVTNLSASATDIIFTNAPADAGSVYYRTEGVNLPFVETVFEGDNLIVRAESWPSGEGVSANVVYSSNGQNWLTKAMIKLGVSGNNDLWEADLGIFPMGISIQYAIEIIDGSTNSVWDNNGSLNHQVSILDPNQPDILAPTLSHSPSNTTTTASSLNVTLSSTDDFDPAPSIFYTTNGSTPTTNSTLYTAAIVVTGVGTGVDMTIKAIARDAAGNVSAVRTIEVRVSETQQVGPSLPPSTNPSFGQFGAKTVDGTNNGEWGTNNLIAIDLANDDPRSLGDNWTMHETPADLTHLWAAWDDNNLYLAYQFVDITDQIDPSNYGSGDALGNNQGILHFISIDTGAGGAASNMWAKNDVFSGATLPDYQIAMRADLWAGASYISKSVNGKFAGDESLGTNYLAAAAAGIQIARVSGHNAAASIWGVPDIDNFISNPNVPLTDYIGHNKGRDTFYEISIPLARLGLTRATLEANGIGVFINTGSQSSLDTIPHDGATLNTPGVEVWNSSKEWSDADLLTSPFARVVK